MVMKRISMYSNGGLIDLDYRKEQADFRTHIHNISEFAQMIKSVIVVGIVVKGCVRCNEQVMIVIRENTIRMERNLMNNTIQTKTGMVRYGSR